MFCVATPSQNCYCPSRLLIPFWWIMNSPAQPLATGHNKSIFLECRRQGKRAHSAAHLKKARLKKVSMKKVLLKKVLQKMEKKNKKQRKIAIGKWANVETQSVQQLPEGIDGLAVYKVKPFTKKNTKALKDGRKWKKTCPTNWKGHSRVRFSDCRGSYRCASDHCPFKIQYGVTNTTQFEKKRNKLVTCKGCGGEGKFVTCSAQRYLSYTKKKVMVYHIGQHTCPITSTIEKKDAKSIEQLVRNNPNIKPSEVQPAIVLNAFQQQMDWTVVEKEAASTIDRKRISNIKQKVKSDIQPFGHNFEAVVAFKEYCDKKDTLYVYKINDRRGNPDKPSFVFKTSTAKANIALNMNVDGEHFMNSEYCFFDGKHNRCRGYITLTASVYHPLLRRKVSLAIMEVEKENTTNVELFWTLFNEAFVKVAKKPTKFNPIGWCTDMAGANLSGIYKVFTCPLELNRVNFTSKITETKRRKNWTQTAQPNSNPCVMTC